MPDTHDENEPLSFVVNGESHPVRYSINLREVTATALAGGEYPILDLPGFTPLTIVDAGANVGATALHFLRHYPSARILCFEPAADNYSLLRANTAPFPAIEAFAAGLGDDDREMQLFHGREQSAQHSLFASGMVQDGDSEAVRIERASSALRRRGVSRLDLIKVDTEGCEVPILRDLLTAFTPGVMYFEIHAESDRIEIDRLLGPAYLLARGRITKPHRGQLAYVRKDLLPGGGDDYYYRIAR
ncbi:MAG: FkbM family methyltransferase [Verrucomicrobia bacterium]|nr:FkbM family methyltransferase [Verrucomicrobiota bacterium]